MANISRRRNVKANQLSLMALADDWPTLAVLDRRYIGLVLDKTGGNKTRAAEVLGIDRRTINRIFEREKAANEARRAANGARRARARAKKS